MSRRNVLVELSAMAEFKKQSTLPTVKDVVLGYNWRCNELKQGKGIKFNPPTYEIQKLVIKDIRLTWKYASLGQCTLSDDRCHAMIKKLIELRSIWIPREPYTIKWSSAHELRRCADSIPYNFKITLILIYC